MQSSLLVHEKCNADIQLIFAQFDRYSRNAGNIKKEFLERLVETYQNIYENFAGGISVGSGFTTPFALHVTKYLHFVPGFPSFIVVYTRISSKTIAILGVMSLETYYTGRAQEDGSNRYDEYLEHYLNAFKKRKQE